MILRGSVFSRLLEMETGITVITPQNYQVDKPYKVAYLLHGLCGANGCWSDYSMLPLFAMDLDVVFVMPEAGRSFYFDMRHGQRFFSYIADELPMLCKKTFNISADREDTAVMGGSMGGYGALKAALARPEQFGCCCAFASACLFLSDQVEDLSRLGNMEGVRDCLGDQLVRDFQGILGTDFAVPGHDRLTELARAVPTGYRPRLYSACGEADDLRGENRRFRDAMLELGFAYVYEEWPGGHDWTFFNAALKKGIEFWLGRTLARG